jgi:hypothetical protein
MATVGPVKLSIEVEGNTKYRVIVDYKITFDDFDITNNIQFRERCYLVAGEYGLIGDPKDVQIPGGSLRSGKIRPNGLATVPRHWETVVSSSTLDEDHDLFDDEDEVYAQVTLKVTSPPSLISESYVLKRSNEYRREF